MPARESRVVYKPPNFSRGLVTVIDVVIDVHVKPLNEMDFDELDNMHRSVYQGASWMGEIATRRYLYYLEQNIVIHVSKQASESQHRGDSTAGIRTPQTTLTRCTLRVVFL